MDHMEAYSIAMTTWANWVDNNMDPSKTRVLFQGVAAVHLKAYHKGCKMTKTVYLLDITLLTQLRKDGYPSVFATVARRSSVATSGVLPVSHLHSGNQRES
ncbi:hypothetical protein V6N12_054734 [Hibiscus sabdariffa]|uniref:Trichome birefringence-like C-terminal domain-containing protein n=1 Tax=Hibiscus sabdariffa TaxID=183260 RepID=A0ABR2D1A8_9ROSI